MTKEYSDKKIMIGFALVLIEVSLLFVIISSFSSFVLGGLGGNVTVTTTLQVGNVSPEVFNVSIDDGAASVTLIANSTQNVSCVALVADYNNDTTIASATAEFFDNVSSTFGGADDNNTHYTNSSCFLNVSFGVWKGFVDDNYTALAECAFEVEYYANAEVWNCTVEVVDNSGLNAQGSDNITIDPLLAIGLPNTIDYGTINSTFVSDERFANVTNVGNVNLNLSLYGYGFSQGDGLAMNCTLGGNKTIILNYEKYNLTASTPGTQTLTQFESNYINLTGSAIVRNFDLAQRQNDTNYGVDDTNSSYWRVYVPTGVAGTCQGNIVFGATTAAGA